MKIQSDFSFRISPLLFHVRLRIPFSDFYEKYVCKVAGFLRPLFRFSFKQNVKTKTKRNQVSA